MRQAFAGMPARVPWSHLLYALGLATCALLALLLRLRGMDPPSLWLDDQWVGIAVTRTDLRQLLEIRPPVPLGFILALKTCRGLLADPEYSLQILPLLCSIAVIPLSAVLVSSWTRRNSLGLVAAVLLTVCPALSIYGVAVKQYAGDCLATVVLLLLGLPLLQTWSWRRAVLTAVFGLATLLFSFTSVFVALPLVNLAALFAILPGAGDRRRALQGVAVALGYDILAAAIYALLLQGQANRELHSYWSGHFLPLGNLSDTLRFLARDYPLFLGGVFPSRLHTLGALALLPATLALMHRKGVPRIGLYFLLFNLGMLAASAFRLFPLGTGRTDIFSYPLTLLVFTLGLHQAFRTRPAAHAAPFVFCALSVVALAAYARPSAYGTPGGYINQPCHDASLVRALERELRDDDALLIYPHGCFSIGYYGRWDVSVLAFDEYAHGFEVQLRRPRTLTLPGYSDLLSRPDRLGPDLARFLAGAPDRRLVYYASFAGGPAHPWIEQQLVRSGYRRAGALQVPAGALQIYDPPR